MAPPTPARHRGPRPQVNNNIGEAGRTTNIAPPKHVPRDSAGHERADEFFDRAINGEDDSDDDMYEQPAPAAKAKQSAKKKAPANGAGREKRAERPDRYMLGEDRGRKTGVVKHLSQRDTDGFEDINNFFKSPSPTRSTATAKSTVKSRKNGSLFNGRPPEYDDENGYEEDGSDMMLDDDGTSLSPLTYQKLHQNHSSARQPSSLRHSTLPSGSKSMSRKGLATSSPNSPRRGTEGAPRRRLSSLSGSGDEADDHDLEDLNLASSGEEEDEDEVVRAALTSKSGAGSAKKLDKGKGKATAVVASDEEEEQYEDHGANGYAYSDEDDQAPSTGRKSTAAASGKKKKPSASRASLASTAASPSNNRRGTSSSPAVVSTSGLLKLDKNGRPVAVPDRKAKGKEVDRSPLPPQQDYYEDDYGGGFDDDGQGGGGGDGDDDGFPQYDEAEFEEQEDPNAPGPSTGRSKGKKESASAAAAAAKKKRQSTASSAAPLPRRDLGRDSGPDSESPPPARKANSSKKRTAGQRNGAVVEQVSRKRQRADGSVDIDGVRRSTRQRIEPLEYWRNERVIYKRRQSGIGMNAIVRVPKEDPAPLTKAGKKKGSSSHNGRHGSARPQSRAASVKNEVPEEEGCDDMTDPDGLVWSWEGNAETTRRIAFTNKMMDPKPTFDGKFAFQKIYQELDYLAGGIMVIPPGGEKQTKPAKDNSYVFYVIQGSVSVTIHRTRFIVGPGGTFFVPRGNHYAIEATSNREVRLFFAQGRRVIEFEDGETRPDTAEDSQKFLSQEQQLDTVQEEEEEEEEEEQEEEEEE